jgi:hypothetical protein
MKVVLELGRVLMLLRTCPLHVTSLAAHSLPPSLTYF